MAQKIKYLVDTNVWLERLLDDFYQLTVSEKYGLILVTFDSDFDVPGLKKTSPQGLIKH